LHRLGERAAAMTEFRRAVPVLIERAFQEQKEDRDGPARIARLVFVLEGYLCALIDGAPKDAPYDGELFAETFRIADFARAGKVQRALALGAARASVRSPELARLVGEREALESRVTTLSGTLSDLLNGAGEKRLDSVIFQLRRDLEAARADAAKLGARIAREHPEFASLTYPRAVTLAEARAALRPGQALVSIYLAPEHAYVWALAHDGRSAMAVRPVSAALVGAWVVHLRKALDVGAAPLERFPAFDVETAHRLYRELLEPVRAAWERAQTLIVIPHRVLGQLPFSLLATAPAQLSPEALPFAAYRRVSWLLRDRAIVQLPAAASLVTLAGLPALRDGRRPFIGFGDPVFGEAAQKGGVTRGAFALRNLTVLRAGGAAATDARVSPSFARLPSLPDTREELREIAALLRADPEKDLFLGLSANESRVKSQDLASHRVIAFATHGLVAGDLEGLDQPALALSNPELAKVEGDGLLAMDEILGLKLNADWVVLSACNTASAGGAGEEAMSGLGRAFFYAGARALLVSNWPVETVSAKLLTTQLFRRQAADARLARAEALRQAMLHLMDHETGKDREGKPLFSYAHPMFWAPFSLVGDGN
jgi:CHAT domain-containing protein